MSEQDSTKLKVEQEEKSGDQPNNNLKREMASKQRDQSERRDNLFLALLEDFPASADKMKAKANSKCKICAFSKKIKNCYVCGELFCRNCVEHYFLTLNKVKVKRIVCFGCRKEILIKNGFYKTEMEKKSKFNYDVSENCIDEPTWEESDLKSTCWKCNKKFFNKKRVCSLCAEFFCRECLILYTGDKKIFKYPYSKSEKQYLCRECNYILINGAEIKPGNTENVETYESILLDLCQKKKCLVPSKNLENCCTYCKKKSKNVCLCSLCTYEFCRLCVQYFRLPPNFDLFADKKKKLNPVCFRCRNDVLKENERESLIKLLHKNAKIDIQEKTISPPNWENPESTKTCGICFKLLTGRRFMCNLCGNVNSKKCVIKYDDSEELFFNPFDINNYYLCLECRYYKMEGFDIKKMIENDSDYSENSSSKNDKKSFPKAQSFFEENFQIQEKVLCTFNCMRKKSMLVLGKMFITDEHFCFYSKVFNNVSKMVIEVGNIKKFTVRGLMKNEFNIEAFAPKKQKIKKYSFMFTIFQNTKYQKFLEKYLSEKNVVLDDTTYTKKNIKEENKVSDSQQEVKFDMLENINLEQLIKTELPLTSDELYDFSFSDNAKYSLFDFYKEEGYDNIILSNWNNESSGYFRSVSFQMEITGIPSFVKMSSNSTPVYRSEKLVKGDCYFAVCANIQTPELPYGDCFELFQLFSVQNNQNGGCNMQVSCAINFIKPIKTPFVQNKISKKSSEEVKDSIERFLERLKQKIEIIKFNKSEADFSNQLKDSQSKKIKELEQKVNKYKKIIILFFILYLFTIALLFVF